MILTSCTFTIISKAAIPASASPLTLPSTAIQQAHNLSKLESYPVSIESWSKSSVQHIVLGYIEQTAWSLGQGDTTSVQLMQPLKSQLLGAGYTVLFECDSQICGGYDFRQAQQIIPPPHMQVDVQNYSYLAAKNSKNSTYILLISSATVLASYLHVTQISPQGSKNTSSPPKNARVPLTNTSSKLTENFQDNGRIVLRSLSFEAGSAGLKNTSDQVLHDLADYLHTHKKAQITLVGHTDITGNTSVNLELSKQRALTVSNLLINTHNVNPEQLRIHGVGPFAPITTNQTQGGREINRRVEAVLFEN